MEQENKLQIFNNEEFGQVRSIKIEGKDYFVANDIAKALGYASPKDAITRHCKGATKVSYLTEGGNQEVKFIPEGDIFRLIIKSKLPEAEKFESWVMDEVLPTLRKIGTYSVGQKENNSLQVVADNILEKVTTLVNGLETKMDDKFKKLEEKQEELEDYYKPTHKKKLGLNGFIKDCLVDNASKENVGRATTQLLFLLGGYETYQEVPIYILEDNNTRMLAYDICKNINISINRGIEIK